MDLAPLKKKEKGAKKEKERRKKCSARSTCLGSDGHGFDVVTMEVVLLILLLLMG